MAKAPKLTGTETKAGKLREMQRLGLTTAKTFSKGAAKVWADYKTEFPRGIPKTLAVVPASDAARKACASVNIKVIGNAIVFPTKERGVVKIRETKHGVFVEYGPQGKKLDSIILSKDGDHLRYGLKLARRNKARENPDETPTMYGTLKVSNYKVGQTEVHTFMRDASLVYEDPLSAIVDDRYATDKLNIETAEIRVTSAFIDRLQQTNGVTALIKAAF